jgi:hypothetical protein
MAYYRAAPREEVRASQQADCVTRYYRAVGMLFSAESRQRLSPGCANAWTVDIKHMDFVCNHRFSSQATYLGLRDASGSTSEDTALWS